MDYTIKNIRINNQTSPRDHYYGNLAKQPRIYVWVDDDETIAENLINRRFRPVATYRKAAMEVMTKAGFDIQGSDISWYKYAGCTMCPCSPAFYVSTDFVADGEKAYYTNKRDAAKYSRDEFYDLLEANFPTHDGEPLSRYRGAEIHITISGAPKIDPAKEDDARLMAELNGLGA